MSNPQAGDEKSFYKDYENWKGWSQPFTYSKEKADYFRGETQGVKVSNADLLEIGFGSGDFLKWAQDQGARVAGTEINPVLLNIAQDNGVELLPSEIETISEQNKERFDTVIAFDVFEHFTLNEIVVRLSAIENMLRDGGHLILRFPNAQSPFGLYHQHGDPTHRSFLSRGIFVQLLQGSKFEIVKYKPSYRILSTNPAKCVVRFIRYCLRDLLSVVMNQIYSFDIPWDSVVVLALRKSKWKDSPDGT